MLCNSVLTVGVYICTKYSIHIELTFVSNSIACKQLSFFVVNNLNVFDKVVTLSLQILFTMNCI